jgi:hypothetical protein
LKVGFLSISVIALVSVGLTVRATDHLDPGLTGLADIAVARLGVWTDGLKIDRVLDMVRHQALSQWPREAVCGPTYVLVAWDGSVAGLDREGRLTGFDAACGQPDLPAFTGFVPRYGSEGERLSAPEIFLGLSILGAFERTSGLIAEISEINLTHWENPRVILTGGTIVDLGQGGFLGKAERLSQVMAQAEYLNTKLRRVDLRFGNQVIVECDGDKSGSRKEV